MSWRVFGALLVLLLAVAGLTGVWPYTLARVESEATIAIVEPGEALIATPGFSEGGERSVSLKQGERVGAFSIKNNLSKSVDIRLGFPDGVPDGVKFDPPSGEKITVPGGGEVDVRVTAAENANADTFPLTVIIDAHWRGGSAILRVKLDVTVEPSIDGNNDDVGYGVTSISRSGSGGSRNIVITGSGGAPNGGGDKTDGAEGGTEETDCTEGGTTEAGTSETAATGGNSSQSEVRQTADTRDTSSETGREEAIGTQTSAGSDTSGSKVDNSTSTGGEQTETASEQSSSAGETSGTGQEGDNSPSAPE